MLRNRAASVALLLVVAVVLVAGSVVALIRAGGPDANAAAAVVDAPPPRTAAATTPEPTTPAPRPEPTHPATATATVTAKATARAKAPATRTAPRPGKQQPHRQQAPKKAAPRPRTGSSHTGSSHTGSSHTGRATFYAADGGGNCSFPAGGDLMVTAMNHQDYAGSATCGDYLAVTGPAGTTITVKVVDQCPECPAGALDLSRQAFAELAAPKTGMITVTWRVVSPALAGPVSYVYKSGSSRYWCAIQVRNHRNPISRLEVRVDGAWQALPRADYNYFLSEKGAGCGGDIRITDSAGHRLTDTGIAITPGRAQPGHAQFPAA